MKFLALPSFDLVTRALSFDTPDCHVTGGCDLYTTKAAGSDKKLYKNIQQSLEARHAELLRFGATLSPSHRDCLVATKNLNRMSPFGSLNETANRRLFAFLIATLNASHPDYDFSQCLRPDDFRRERNLRRVMNDIDSTLFSVRAGSTALDVGLTGRSPGGLPSSVGSGTSIAPAWSAQSWSTINDEMALKDCVIFSYHPADGLFDEEEQAIWALHYFFFNKALKRVCYLYVRGLPVMSYSARVQPRPHLMRDGRLLAGQGRALGADGDDDEWQGASKRARYWLGESFADRLTMDDDDDMDDDGLIWNRDADGDMCSQFDDGDDDDDDDEEAYGDSDAEQAREEHGRSTPGSKRGSAHHVDEDIASRMELGD